MAKIRVIEINQLAQRFSRLPRKIKRFLMLTADMAMVPVALFGALLLHHGVAYFGMPFYAWQYLLAIAVVIPLFAKFGLYRTVVRFMGAQVINAVLASVVLSVLIFVLLTQFLVPFDLPLSVLINFGLICILSVGGSRYIVRSLLQRQRVAGDRVAIYGAGDAGAFLASSLAGGHEYSPVAFLDDNAALQGSVINGIEVFSPNRLGSLIETLNIKRVLLAVPSASSRRRRRIIESLESQKVHVQTMPDMADLVSGVTRVDSIREVDVADLLGRDTVPPDESLLGACIRDKVVLVTGAGGSIGSELCRQIVRQSPKRLLLFELSELALYTIHRALSLMIEADKQEIELIPLLGSAHNKSRMLQVMNTFQVQTVYHAAAYKHVPMVEYNMIEGIHNNIFGTYHCAEAAIECNVETFVLISTDKAVCPTNVMGVTKRMAEIVLQGLDERGCNTRFCIVRFGNVLASSGSVVPLFREQIKRGGPVTVTHPEIIRYFMTIPEAAQLVLQAGSMGTGGDVFLLDMGKPVRIEDLARRMIQLMGLTVMDDENPDGDIEIQYTGLRPAEKLYEELLIGNNAMGTEHPMIMRAEEKCMQWTEVELLLERLRDASLKFDCQSALNVLKKVVEEYTPASGIADHVWVRRLIDEQEQPRIGRVTAIAAKKSG